MADTLAVLDANVYIRAAVRYRSAGGVFPTSWVIPPSDPRQAALALIGALAGISVPTGTDQRVRLYTSGQLEDTVYLKLTQPTSASRREEQGLGWTAQDVEDSLYRMQDALYAACKTIIFDDPIPPYPLTADTDYEDACVYGLFHKSIDDDATLVPVLVTLDGDFARDVNGAAATPSGRPLWVAQSPGDFLAYLAS